MEVYMDSLKNFLNIVPSAPDDIDFLLECASVTRELIENNQHNQLSQLICHTIENNYTDAFLWAIGIIQEEITKTDSSIDEFQCSMGRRIANYDSLIASLQVDFNCIKNYIEKVYDKNGEVEAFFNVMIYTTAFENVYLVSSENFDNKDNDYVQYNLLFTKELSTN